MIFTIENLIRRKCWYLLQERNSTEDSDVEEVADITQWEAIGWLSILTLWVSVLSGYLIDTLQVRSTFPFSAMIWGN